MALINIDYGSLASSEIMNKNFLYLDEKIADASENLSTSISSLLSNIATLNTRIVEVSDEVKEASEDLSGEISEAESKLNIAIDNYSMVPNWSACIGLAAISNYVVPSNGFLLICPATTANGTLNINGAEVFFKKVSSGNDYAAILTSMPVREGDVVNCYCGILAAYFLPVIEGGKENA